MSDIGLIPRIDQLHLHVKIRVHGFLERSPFVLLNFSWWKKY